MRRILLSVFIGLVGLGFTAADVEARRLGGGMSQGMKRQMPAQRTPDNPPPQQQPNSPAATPATAGAAAAAPAAAARRSWMGPIAGIAGILGLAALASYFGLSEMFANIAAMLLLGIVVLLVVRWAMRRFSTSSSARPSGLGYAAAGGAPGAQGARRSVPEALAVSSGANVLPADARPAAAAHGPHLPPGFDRAEFERAAKMIFVRMQAANDAGDLDDLRQFSTPEMFAAFRLDLQ
ncbi:MAG TPA: TIM44-like domain-containing protein, partial [Albitalea sp.]